MDILNDVIYPVIDEMKEIMDEPEMLVKSPDMVLFGSTATLDSLDLVNLIVGIESKIEEITDRTIVLANEKAMSRKNSPFLTIKTLQDYIQELLKDEND